MPIDASHITPAMARRAMGLKGSKKEATASRNKFITKLKNQGASQTVSWELNDLIRTETRAELESLLVPNSKSKTSVEERVAWWMEQMERSMEFIGGESRSTSQADNLVTDIQNRIKLAFYSDLCEARRYDT